MFPILVGLREEIPDRPAALCVARAAGRVVDTAGTAVGFEPAARD